MEKNEDFNFSFADDMPHEKYMDENAIEFSDLSSSIQDEIREFDNVLFRALEDGELSDEEYSELYHRSQGIIAQIKNEGNDKDNDINDNSGKDHSGSILFGILLGIGAVIGIEKLIKS